MTHLLVTTMSMMCAVALAGSAASNASDAAASDASRRTFTREEFDAIAVEVPHLISGIAMLAASARRLTFALQNRLEHPDLPLDRNRARSRSIRRVRSGPNDVGASQLGESEVDPEAVQQSHNVSDIIADRDVIEGLMAGSQNQNSQEESEESSETYHRELVQDSQVGSIPGVVCACRATDSRDATIAPSVIEVVESQVQG